MLNSQLYIIINDDLFIIHTNEALTHYHKNMNIYKVPIFLIFFFFYDFIRMNYLYYHLWILKIYI